jgi:hypothetical protein
MRPLSQMVAVILVGMLVCSCQTNMSLERKFEPSSGVLAAESRDSADLAYRLSSQTWCSNDEACSMVLLLIDGEDRYQGFDDRLIALDAKGVADASWDIEAEEPVSKGTLAYMLCRTLGLKGGVILRLLPSRRYAYREAVYKGLMAKGSAGEPLTGPEAVGIIGRAARMKEGETILTYR